MDNVRTSIPEPPAFLNWPKIAGSTGPVVTTLLAGIALAAFITGFQDGIAQRPIYLWPLTHSCAIATTLFGFVSMSFFILATVRLVWAQTEDVSDWSQEKLQTHLHKYLSDQEKLKDSEVDSWRQRSESVVRRYVDSANSHAYSGIVFMILTIGSLASTKGMWLGTIIGIVAEAVSIGMLTDKRMRGWGILTAISSGWFVLSGGVALWNAYW